MTGAAIDGYGFGLRCSCRLSMSSDWMWHGASRAEALSAISACHSKPRANASGCGDETRPAVIGEGPVGDLSLHALRPKACHMFYRAVLALTAIILWAAPALAQPKTDVVTLSNGDRITGEIASLSRGRLELKTDDAGTIDIEWDNIARVEATRQFEIGTSDGRRLLGSLGRTSDRVVMVVGMTEVLLPMTEVTTILPIGATFWAKLEGSIDAGFSYTRSSGIAQVTFNTSTQYRRPSFVVQLTASATVTEQADGGERDDRAAMNLSYIRYFGHRWFIGGAGRLENNESLGLLLRSEIAGVVGQRLVNTNHAQFEVGGGIVLNDEQGVDTAATQNIEGLIVANVSYYAYDRPRTNFDLRFLYYPSLSNFGRQRVQIDSAVKRELWKDFFFSLSVYYTFDSDPPNPEAARADTGVVTSLGWSY